MYINLDHFYYSVNYQFIPLAHFSIRSYFSLDDVLILILSFVWLLLLVKTRALYRPMLPLFNANFLKDKRYFIF